MNYLYHIAYLGKRPIKSLGPSPRFEMFDDNSRIWVKLIEAHGDIFKNVGHRLGRVDGKPITWYSLYEDQIYKRHLIGDLGQESPEYAYDTETESIVFIYDHTETFENYKDEIAEFISSGQDKLVFK